ncbi:MAG: hypothetical protein JWQ76_5057 [Ramlibacter sp.]|nr:hypothetical protein [Ramlibacter sp.]
MEGGWLCEAASVFPPPRPVQYRLLAGLYAKSNGLPRNLYWTASARVP